MDMGARTETLWNKMQASGENAMQQGNTGQAAAQFEAAVSEAESEHSEARLLISLRNLADAYYVQGKISEAEQADVRAQQLRGTEQVVGKSDDANGSRLAKLAQSCHERGQCEIAENLFKKAVQISTAGFGENSLETADRIENLATFYTEMGQVAKAEPLKQKALQIKGSLSKKSN
jgi:tetratricopeptide (TPR) repeat protein